MFVSHRRRWTAVISVHADGTGHRGPSSDAAARETELRKCRREVYVYKKQHDAAWLTKVEAHRRKEKAQALRPRVSGLGRAQVAAAAAADAAWPHERVEASVFARVLQDIEDRCLGCVRRVL